MKFEIRKSKQNSYCRCCDKEMLKDKDTIVYMYSIRNRGQNIILCLDCIKEINDKISEVS